MGLSGLNKYKFI
jgi:hypothetical protein